MGEQHKVEAAVLLPSKYLIIYVLLNVSFIWFFIFLLGFHFKYETKQACFSVTIPSIVAGYWLLFPPVTQFPSCLHVRPLVATLTHQHKVQFQHWTGKYPVKCPDQELDSLGFCLTCLGRSSPVHLPTLSTLQAATCPPPCKSFLLQLQPAFPQGLTGTCPCHESYQSGVVRGPSFPS